MVANRSPSTYVVDVPVVVTKVSSRDLRLSFCHIGAEKFWEEHDLLDPKLGNPPAMEGGNDPSKFLPVVLCGDGAQAWFHQRDPYSPACLLPLFQCPRCCWYLSQSSSQQVCVAGRGHHAPYLEGAGMGLQAHIWRLKQGTKCSWLKKKGWAANAVRVDDENCLGSKIWCASLLVLEAENDSQIWSGVLV